MSWTGHTKRSIDRVQLFRLSMGRIEKASLTLHTTKYERGRSFSSGSGFRVSLQGLDLW
jgi:hypothetical protein